MAWTAALKAKEQLAGRIKLAIEYSDGVTTLVELLDITRPGDAKRVLRQVRDRLAELEKLDTLFQNLNLGPFDFTLLDPVPPIPPDPADVAELTWVAKWGRLLRTKKLIAEGILAGGAPEFVALKLDVKATFLPGYVDSISGAGD